MEQKFHMQRILKNSATEKYLFISAALYTQFKWFSLELHARKNGKEIFVNLIIMFKTN